MSESITNPLATLSASETARLTSEGEIRTFAKGETVFASGEKVSGIFCLLDGTVRIVQVVENREVSVRVARSGEWVGHRSIFTSETYRGSAIAEGDAKVIFVPTKLLLSLFTSNPDFALQLILMIARDFEKAERLMLGSNTGKTGQSREPKAAAQSSANPQ